MHGFPIEISKVAMEKLLRRMRPNDLFNVILFASGTKLFSEKSIVATDKNLMDAIEFINKRHGHGGTEIMPALELALNMPHNEGYSKSIVVMTDGLVGVDKKAVNYIRDNLNKANLYSFGIGSSINRFLIEAMALAGAGEPLVITAKEGAEKSAERFMKYIESPVMTNVSIEFDGFMTYDVEPIKPFDLTAERPIIVYGKYEGHPSGTIILRGKTAKQELHVKIPVDKFGRMDQSNTIKYIYARNKLKLIEMYDNFGKNHYNYNYNDNSKLSFEDAITEIGMKYNLLTEHTSFVAIDSELRNASGEYDTVNQPLPTPEGMVDFMRPISMTVVKRASGELTGYYPSRAAARGRDGVDLGGFSNSIDLATPLLPTYEDRYSGGSGRTDLVVHLKDSSRVFDYTLENMILNGKLFLTAEGKYDRIEIPKKYLIDDYIFSEIDKTVKDLFIKASEQEDFELPEEKSGPFSLTLKLPDKFMMEYKGKKVEAEKKDNKVIALLKEGSGEQVLIGYKADIKVSIFDGEHNLLKTHTYSDILGFGKVPDIISSIVHKSKRGTEKLIWFAYWDNTTILTGKEIEEYGYKIKYITIKVL
jgi:hypothetical protein